MTLPDGAQRALIPGLQRWIRDAGDDGPEGFASSINLHWMVANAAFPPHTLGHIGYAVVP